MKGYSRPLSGPLSRVRGRRGGSCYPALAQRVDTDS